MIVAKRFIEKFEEYCPLWLAEPNDPVGLHIGTLDKPIQKVMMTLDVRPEVVEEAIEKKVDLIIAKHPPIFRPIKRLTTEDPQNKMYLDLVQHNIAVYAAHTNMDIINDGLNDWFCDMLGIEAEDYLVQTHEIALKKLAVYIPVPQAKSLREALGKVGAGQQGNYKNTSYSLIGTGRFTPQEGAHPAIGAVGEEETVQESRIEVVFPETLADKVLAAMFEVHPYEEPVYDLFTLDNSKMTYGIGRVGFLKTPMTLDDFAKKAKQAFQLDGLRIVRSKEKDQLIHKVAICGGSGEKFYSQALKQKADVYITGDITYHTAHDMQANGLAAIDPGHTIERECIPRFIQKFEEWKVEENWEVDFIASETSTNPFEYK